MLVLVLLTLKLFGLLEYKLLRRGGHVLLQSALARSDNKINNVGEAAGGVPITQKKSRVGQAPDVWIRNSL